MSKGNEPAYPNELAAPTNDGYLSTAGLTKREYFAGLAMQGYLACETFAKNGPEAERQSGLPIHVGIAMMAVQQANALLAELEKTA